MKFIIEHLEEKMYKWCVIEYEHISEVVGRDNVIFTNVKSGREKVARFGKVYRESVIELDFPRACILDPVASETLESKDASRFDYLILGGILGDYPMRERTKSELSSKMRAPVRNLGKEQMSTDTAAYVAKMIIDGKCLSEIRFQDDFEIQFEDGLSMVLPYRYVVEDGKVWLSGKLFRYLKQKKGF